MPGHNGLFARQFPIASTYCEYTEISGFDRRRFDLFAIVQLAVAIVIEDRFSACLQLIAKSGS